MQARTLIRIAVAVAALGMVGAAASAATKPTLTVAISGDGSVTSRPGRINCHPTCKLHVRTGLKVMLTASANNGSEFSHWSAPCGTSFQVHGEGDRLARRARILQGSASSSAAASSPPPPPPAKAGNYAGTYTDGTFIKFEVGPSGSSLGNISYDLNGHCSDGGTSYGESFAPGPFAISARWVVPGHVLVHLHDRERDAQHQRQVRSGRFGLGDVERLVLVYERGLQRHQLHHDRDVVSEGAVAVDPWARPRCRAHCSSPWRQSFWRTPRARLPRAAPDQRPG